MPKVDEVMLTESSLRDAAIDLFDDIYLPSIPEPARYYIDYHLFAQGCLNSGDQPLRSLPKNSGIADMLQLPGICLICH